MSEQDWFGRYRVFECVGSGGMATVHRARIAQGNVELEVALKRLLPHLVEDEHFVRDFVREAKLAANLHHPNIVRVYELGRIDDTYFIAMELVRGVPLTAIIRAGRPSPIGPVLAIMLELTEALDYAHDGIGGDGRRNQVIHRDLTPSNLLITEEGSLKIIDFGVAKALTGELATNSGFAKGKLGYMAPEQVEAIRIDGRADLYSAGIVMWELLTGGRLFQPKNDLDVGVLELVASPPSIFNPDIPAAIDEIVMRALEKDASRRYQSAADFHRAVAQALRTYASSATRRDVKAWIESVKPRDHSDDYVGYEVVNESSRLTPPGTLSGLTPSPSLPIRSHPRAPREVPRGNALVSAAREWPPEPLTPPQVEYSQWPVEPITQRRARPAARGPASPNTTRSSRRNRRLPPNPPGATGPDVAAPPLPTVPPASGARASSQMPRAASPPDVAAVPPERRRASSQMPRVAGPSDEVVVPAPSPDGPVVAVRFRPPTVVPPDGAPAEPSATASGVRFRPPTTVPPPTGAPASASPGGPGVPAVRFRPPTTVPPPEGPHAGTATSQQERDARAAPFADDHAARVHEAPGRDFSPEPTISEKLVLEPAAFRPPSADDFAAEGSQGTTREVAVLGGPVPEAPMSERTSSRPRRTSTGMRAPRRGAAVDDLGTKPKKR